jgi:3,5-dioxohexanoate:acetyl-CoA acetone transferase
MIYKIHRKAIITAAITGAIHTTAMLPYLPTTPQQIFGDIMRAYDAGGTVAHYHARDTRTDRPNADQTIFKEVVTDRCLLK